MARRHKMVRTDVAVRFRVINPRLPSLPGSDPTALARLSRVTRRENARRDRRKDATWLVIALVERTFPLETSREPCEIRIARNFSGILPNAGVRELARRRPGSRVLSLQSPTRDLIADESCDPPPRSRIFRNSGNSVETVLPASAIHRVGRQQTKR
jgi:hypothetical protein